MWYIIYPLTKGTVRYRYAFFCAYFCFDPEKQMSVPNSDLSAFFGYTESGRSDTVQLTQPIRQNEMEESVLEY
jgi:hypothetical protein